MPPRLRARPSRARSVSRRTGGRATTPSADSPPIGGSAPRSLSQRIGICGASSFKRRTRSAASLAPESGSPDARVESSTTGRSARPRYWRMRATPVSERWKMWMRAKRELSTDFTHSSACRSGSITIRIEPLAAAGSAAAGAAARDLRRRALDAARGRERERLARGPRRLGRRARTRRGASSRVLRRRLFAAEDRILVGLRLRILAALARARAPPSRPDRPSRRAGATPPSSGTGR